MILYLDIETLPCDDPEFISAIADTITAPAQYKKPESIAEWLKDNKEQAVKDAVAKTSFDGRYGRIACICYAFDDGEVFSVDANESGDERTMLCHLYSHIYDITTVAHETGIADIPATVCGHNVAGFDLTFMKKRSIICGVTPPKAIRTAMSAKPWSEIIADTMLMWDAKNFASMDSLCKVLGIPGKGDMDGSKVAETWLTDPTKVVEYCKGDVDRTRQIYKRLTWNQS